jgi:hypothetical protein
MHVWKRLIKSSARSPSSHVKHVRTNKLCLGPFCLRCTCHNEYVLNTGTHPGKQHLAHSRRHQKNLKYVSLWLSRSVNICAHVQSKKQGNMLGWVLGIMFTAQWFRMCKSQHWKYKAQARTLNNSANVFFKCVLPAFSLAQLASTDPKQTTIKNIRKLLQSTLAWA